MTDATLIPFRYGDTPVRTVRIDGDPWFVLSDLCSVLNLTTPAKVVSRLEDGMSSTHPIPDSLGRIQHVTIVNESGMYRVVLRSDKPEALAFQAWITDEVLPSVRKTGSYSLPGVTSTPSAEDPALVRARQLVELHMLAQGVVSQDHLEAKIRIILAQARGEHPEIEAKARPLYTQDYMREKGATRDEVRRFSPTFGKYVKKAYAAEHDGKDPDVYLQETSSGQVREVCAYTEADRPLLDRIWSESYANGFPEKTDKKTKKNKEKK